MHFGRFLAKFSRARTKNALDVTQKRIVGSFRDGTADDDRGVHVAVSGLTSRQRGGASCVDPEQRRAALAVFIISKPRYGLPRSSESPLSRKAACCSQEYGDRHRWPFDNRGGRAVRALHR